MDYKAIVKEAWEVAQTQKNFIWLGSISAFITTVVGLGYLVYQIKAFQNSSLSYTEEIESLLNVIKNHTTISIVFAILVILFLIAKMFIPLILNGALIDLIAKLKQNRSLKGGVAKGIVCLFPMFKYHAIMSPFGLFSILIELSFVLRLSGIQILYIVLPFFTLFFLLGFIMTIIFSFTDQYIILKNESFATAMGYSTKLVLVHFKETIFLILLMLLISIRILINVVLILFIPLAIVTLSSYLASVIFNQIGIYIAVGVGFVLLLLTAYFIGTLNVFTAGVWTLSYLKMTEEEHLEEV